MAHALWCGGARILLVELSKFRSMLFGDFPFGASCVARGGGACARAHVVQVSLQALRVCMCVCMCRCAGACMPLCVIEVCVHTYVCESACQHVSLINGSVLLGPVLLCKPLPL